MKQPMTVEVLQAGLIEHDKGVLKHGSHEEGSREFCALEFVSIMKGIKFCDNPSVVGMPDLRSLNDAFGTGSAADARRTAAMLPVLAALWNWDSWGQPRQQKFAERLVIKTVNRIISQLPGLPAAVVLECKGATTIQRAARAARAAGWAVRAARAAGAAAEWAARAAGWAARVVRAAVLEESCKLFVEAAEESLLIKG
jgi:hypothetical protein